MLKWGRCSIAVAVACVSMLSSIVWGATAPAEGDWRPASGALPEGLDDGTVAVRTLAAQADTQRLQFRFPEPRLERSDDGLLDVLLPTTPRSGAPGEPLLPVVSTRIAIPQGHELVAVSVTPENGRELVLDGPVRHAQELGETAPLASIYSSDVPFPASLSSPASVHTKQGVTIVHFSLHPVVYRPVSGLLTAYELLSVSVVTRPTPVRLAATTEAAPWRARFRSAEDAAAVSGILDNPTVLAQYQPESAIAVDGVSAPEIAPDAAGDPQLPCLASDTYRHVIITTEELRDALIEGGWASAQTNQIGHAYLFLAPEEGTSWDVDRATVISNAAAIGGYEAIANEYGEGTYITNELDQLPGVSTWAYAIEFDVTTNDANDNAIADWFEFLPGAQANGTPFPLTSPAPDDTFTDIVDLRSGQGLSSVIVLMESILMHYHGVDEAEALRTFIRDAYDKWGTQYVLLGGAAHAVPVRRLAPEGGFWASTPSDLYYQCLDGSFDSDQDLIWGEPTDGGDRLDGRPGEDVDLYAELSVGRVPASNGQHVVNWVRRQLSYEQDRLAGGVPYQSGALLLAEEPRFGSDSALIPAAEHIRLGASSHGYRTVGFADSETYTNIVTLYDSETNSWSTDDLVDRINSDQFSLINHVGEGGYFDSMKLSPGQPSELLTNEKSLFLYSQASWGGGFFGGGIAPDLAAELVVGAQHGLFGAVVNSADPVDAEGSTDGAHQRLNRWFWHGFFGEAIPVTGLLNALSHERNAARINLRDMRSAYYQSNLLGDPAQWLAGVEAFVRLDRDAYASTDEPIVEVFWPGAELGRTTAPVTVEIFNAANILQITTNITCARVGPVGFTARFQSDPVSLTALGAQHSDIIRISADLPFGAALVTRTDEAPIDDVPPVISNLRVTALDDAWVEIAFETDTPAVTAARIGDVLPLDAEWQEGPTDYGTNHMHRFERLLPLTRYFMAVRASDVVGNTTMLPTNIFSTVETNYLTVATIGRETIRRFDWVNGSDEWTTDNINSAACWQYGQPAEYGPQASPRCWATVLNGRYPDGANAYLSSPPFTVRGGPVLLFRHWHDMHYSMDMDDVAPSPPPHGDYGQIEVFADGVWQNVTEYADVAEGKPYISGASDGWLNVRVALPDTFANRTLAVRYRFVSDQQHFGDGGNPAGWYVDDLRVQDVPGSGFGISQLDVQDSGAGLDGDGDGFPEPGETISLRPHLFNYGSVASGALTGSVVVLVGGNPATEAVLLDGNPAPISYPSVGPGLDVPASDWFRLALSTNLAPGSVVTLLQTVTNGVGDVIVSRYDLVLDPIVQISGTVTDALTGSPAEGVVLRATSAGVTLTATSEADGTYLINGTSPSVTYWVTASQLGTYTPQGREVEAPAENVDFAMGRSIGSLTPRSLAYDVVAGASESHTLTVSNAVVATERLSVTLETIRYNQNEHDWLSLDPEDLLLDNGRAGELVVTADAASLSPGVYTAVIVLTLNDPLLPEIEIPVHLLVRRVPALVFGGIFVEDDTDGDAHLEAGETGDMWLYLNNIAGLSDVADVQGTLTPMTNAVTVNGSDAIVWDYIAPYSSRLSTNGVSLTLDPGIAEGAILEFELELRWNDGLDLHTNTLAFSFVHYTYSLVTGRVEAVVWDEETAAISTNIGPIAISGAVVRAEDVYGYVHYSLPSDSNGYYEVSSVPWGDSWFSVQPPSDYPYVPPAGSNVVVNTDPQTHDIMLGDYGTNAPHLRLAEISFHESYPSDYDGAIEPGEQVHVHVRLRNDGTLDALAVTSVVTVADMGALGPFMDVTNGVDVSTVISSDSYYGRTFYFSVNVHSNAAAGDMQRFWVTATDGELVPRVWPFDFSLTVDTLYAISGVVTNTDGVPIAGVDVELTYAEGQRDMAITDAFGRYTYDRLRPGLTNLILIALPPEGYSIEPLSHTVALLDGDISGLDFVLKESLFTLSPTNLSATIREGETTNASFTVDSNMSTNLTATLRVAYKRGVHDVIPPAADPLLATLASTSDWSELDPDAFVEDEIEVRFADGTGWGERDAILQRHGLRALFHFKLVPACLAVPVAGAVVGEGVGLAALAPLGQELSADPDILYARPAAKASPLATPTLPDDSLFDREYGLWNVRQTGGTQGADINVEPVWSEHTTGSRDIVVAVCDTGIDLNHTDLLPNIWQNPLERAGDRNQDGAPGARGVDDDKDAAEQRFHYNTVNGDLQGPETVHPLFAPEMWQDSRSYVPALGGVGIWRWVDGGNDIPDYFEPHFKGEETPAQLAARAATVVDVNGNVIPDVFRDTDGNGLEDIFEDSNGDGLPDIAADEDGDGLYNETGIDFRDEDVMTAQYATFDADFNAVLRPVLTQKIGAMYWGGRSVHILIERWNSTGLASMASDDDENGYVDDMHGWNFFHWDNDVTDGDVLSSHGTHVAGTIGAVGDNAMGVAGVNWTASIMPLAIASRVDEPATVQFTSYTRIAKAIEYALEKDVRVSNHSWGGSQTAGVMFEIMKIAEERYNHLFVIAAGNDANDLDNRRVYPAYYSTVLNNVITVAAHDHDAQLATFSCWGLDSVQIAAPGVDILSTASSRSIELLDYFMPEYVADLRASGKLLAEKGQFYRVLDGTSMATPHVAGAAALLWAHAPAARFQGIKNALLEGARPEANLQGWLKTGGRLDLGRAVAAMGREWLVLSTNQVALAPFASETVTVTFNPETNTPSGFYEADIVAESAAGVRRLPVSLTVLDTALAEAAVVRIIADSDSDGFAEPGETVRFVVALHNRGAGTFANLRGILTAVTPGATVTTDAAAWDYLYGGDSGESLTAFEVMVPGGASAETLFDLALTADEVNPQTLRVILPTVVRHSVRGRVFTTLGVGVPNALVEGYGATGMRARSDATGIYALHGLSAGSCTVRAIPDGYTRSAALDVTVAGDVLGVDLVVAAPDMSVSSPAVSRTLASGMRATTNLVVLNAATSHADDAYTFDVEVMPQRRIGLFDDGARLGVLVAPLARMGFHVDHYTNNFALVHDVNVETALEQVLEVVQHTWDDEKVFAYDLVIADLTGANGGGRRFSESEADVFQRYLDRGGRVIFTGGNPLSRPDNEAMAALCGLDMDRAAAPTNAATAVADWNGAFVQLGAGDSVITTNWTYDLANAAEGVTVDTLFTAGSAAKITHRDRIGARGTGVACLWGGNPGAADWREEGVWLDVLRDMLRDSFLQPAATRTTPAWLTVTPASGTAAINGGTVVLSVEMDAASLPSGEYAAVMVLRGLDRDEEAYTIPVRLTVSPFVLRAFTSGSVTDWSGSPLRGDGGESSALYQVIYAGADGEPGAPNTQTGAPTGDDQLLVVSPDGHAFGRFGDGIGVPANTGRFDRLFANTVPHDTSNALVYVRAWEQATFNASLTYGDSTVRHALTFVDGEAADFGSWSVTNVIDAGRDSNSNSLPDGWIINQRPDLDPRAGLAPLAASYQLPGAIPVEKADAGEPATQPYRVVASVSNTFLFVLDKANNRLVTIPSDAPSQQTVFGTVGDGPGQFGQPEGLAADLRTGETRLAVADTENHRVQLFTYDPLSGALTFERTIGSYGSGDGQLDRPSGVAFDHTGRIFVADRTNHRIAIFRASDGSWLGSFNGGGTAYVLDSPRGLCVDPSVSDGGVWVCDTGNNRVTLYSTTGLFRRSIGRKGSEDGQFESPVDAQLWQMGSRRWLVVVDKVNSRLQLFSVDGAHQLSVGTQPGELLLPHGVAPLPNSRELLVADTGNSRVQRLLLTLDVDKDGMDDFWEDRYGLGVPLFDAYGDLDGDGLSNIAEYLIGSDPSVMDTDGDGQTDGENVQAGEDPLRLLSLDPLLPFSITGITMTPFSLSWETEVGVLYQVETNALLLDTTGWGVFTNFRGTASPTSTLQFVPEQKTLYFRIKRGQ
jgi:subtilisin family serine protease